MKKNSAFKLRSGNKPSPAKLFSGETRRMKLARKYELEDRKEAHEQSKIMAPKGPM